MPGRRELREQRMLRSNESLRGMLRECRWRMLVLELRKVKKGEEKVRLITQ
jgi:hypothetical protein